MNDAQADGVVHAVLDLAIAMRDGEAPTDVHRAATAVLNAAQGDLTAVLCIAAALIPVDQPVDPWWQRGLAGLGGSLGMYELTAELALPPREIQPCGTRAAYQRHCANGEPVDDACRGAFRAYERARYRYRARAKNEEGMTVFDRERTAS